MGPSRLSLGSTPAGPASTRCGSRTARWLNELPESVVVAERLEVGIEPRLGAGFRAEGDGVPQKRERRVGRVTTRGNGGQEIQRQILPRFFSQDALRQLLGFAVLADVQRGRGGREPLLDRLGRGGLPAKLALAQIQIDPRPI